MIILTFLAIGVALSTGYLIGRLQERLIAKKNIEFLIGEIRNLRALAANLVAEKKDDIVSPYQFHL